MKEDRDIYLNELIGNKPIDFSEWYGFGVLFTYAKDQEWFKDFCVETPMYTDGDDRDWIDAMIDINNPDKFADAIYEYLKERKS